MQSLTAIVEGDLYTNDNIIEKKPRQISNLGSWQLFRVIL